MKHKIEFSAYRVMWIVVLFDLPSVTKKEKREYIRFTKYLKREGFFRFQYSVFNRFCPNKEYAFNLADKIKYLVPPEGRVSIFFITDKQYGQIRNYYGKEDQEMEKPPPHFVHL